MQRREKKTYDNTLKFKDDDILMVVSIVEKLETTMEVIYYLMEHENLTPFSLILLTAEEVEIHKILINEKRDTDIVVQINKEKNIYLLLCQNTYVDGGYHFAERIMNHILSNDGKNIYCTELEVRSTKNAPKAVIFKLVNMFMKAQAENKTNEIVYRSIN